MLQARRSRQGRAPLVEPSILRRRPYVAGLAVVLGFIGAMGGMMIALNVMFQTGLGLTPLACAVATVAIPRGRDRRVDHLVGAAGQDRADDDAHRDRGDGGRPDRRRSRAALRQRRRDRVGPGRTARDHRLRHGHGVRPDVRRDPRGRRSARARFRVGPARVGPAAGDVDRYRRRRHRAVRPARRRHGAVAFVGAAGHALLVASDSWRPRAPRCSGSPTTRGLTPRLEPPGGARA